MNDLADITVDAVLGGRLILSQPKRGHRAGHDAILLAAATPAHSGDRVVDFGAGVGTAGLAVARRVPGVELVLVEIDPALAMLARHNAVANDIQARIVALDIAASAAEFSGAALGPDSVDTVLMNPPFHDDARHRASPDAGRSLAHTASRTTLDCWVHAARRVLKPGGTLVLIWRADALVGVLSALQTGLGSIEVLPVHSHANSAAIRIIVRTIKGGRAPLILHPPLILNDDAGQTRPAVNSVLNGTATLPLSRQV